MRHILEYCNQIEDAVKRIGSYDNLLSDQFFRNALSMPFVQIGELVRIISADLKDRHTDIPWIEIKSLRNHLIHSYGMIDWYRVWDTVINDIPQLKNDIEKLLEKLEVSSLEYHLESFCNQHSGNHIQNEMLRKDYEKYLPQIAKRVMRIPTEQSREEAFRDEMRKWLRETYSDAEVAEALKMPSKANSHAR